MILLIDIIYILIGLYSIIGGIILLISYVSSPAESKSKFSETNKQYLIRLIKYTLFVIIPVYFWQDIYFYLGSYKRIDIEWIYGILSVPIFLWANASIMIISLLFNEKK